MYPAARASLNGLLVVTLVFGVVTISTMLTIVLVSIRGLELIPIARLNRYAHALAGVAVLFSGLAIRFLGL